MLQKLGRHHDVTHLNARPQATCHACKHNALGAKGLNQGGGRGRSGYFADFGQGQHYRVAVQFAAPKIPPCAGLAGRVVQLLNQPLLLLEQGAENGRGQLFATQLAAQNFADRGFGQFISELNHFGLLVTGEIFTAIGAYFGFCQVRVFLDDDQLDGLT